MSMLTFKRIFLSRGEREQVSLAESFEQHSSDVIEALRRVNKKVHFKGALGDKSHSVHICFSERQIQFTKFVAFLGLIRSYEGYS